MGLRPAPPPYPPPIRLAARGFGRRWSCLQAYRRSRHFQERRLQALQLFLALQALQESDGEPTSTSFLEALDSDSDEIGGVKVFKV